MQIDGPKYQNPVVLSEGVDAANFTTMLSTLPEYRYRNRIVGFSDHAVYVCTHRIAQLAYYEMVAEPIPWSRVTHVGLGRSFSMVSVLIGAGLMLLGVILFFAGWVWKTHTGPAVFWIPFAAPVAGLAFLVGSRRLRMTVHHKHGRAWWIAPPLFQFDEELRERLAKVSHVDLGQ